MFNLYLSTLDCTSQSTKKLRKALEREQRGSDAPEQVQNTSRYLDQIQRLQRFLSWISR